MNKKNTVLVFFLDLLKVFDTTDHVTLEDIVLQIYPSKTIAWLSNYLPTRTQKHTFCWAFLPVSKKDASILFRSLMGLPSHHTLYPTISLDSTKALPIHKNDVLILIHSFISAFTQMIQFSTAHTCQQNRHLVSYSVSYMLLSPSNSSSSNAQL